jgi:ankyrin repeat protein
MPRMDAAIVRAFKEQEFDSGMALVQQVPDLANYQSAAADDMSLLMAAAWHGETDIVRQLVEGYCANPFLQERNGKSALHYAHHRKQTAVVELLMDN